MVDTRMWKELVAIDISSDESSSDEEVDMKPEVKPTDSMKIDQLEDIEFDVNLEMEKPKDSMRIDQPTTEILPEDGAGFIIRRAKMYQRYMKHIPVPTPRGSVIPFTTWMELGRSIKQLYGQPLHYLTNILLRQWDQSRFGSEDEHQPLDFIVHPRKAEANIWLVEEVHRQTTSHHYIAKLWLSDPTHYTHVDSIIKEL